MKQLIALVQAARERIARREAAASMWDRCGYPLPRLAQLGVPAHIHQLPLLPGQHAPASVLELTIDARVWTVVPDRQGDWYHIVEGAVTAQQLLVPSRVVVFAPDPEAWVDVVLDTIGHLAEEASND